MGWIIALLGLAASVGGGGAIVMGWPLVPSPAMLDNAADANRPASARPAQATGDEARSAPEGEAAAAGETQPARSFTVGDTTFVVFSDGSIEARTTEGTRRFRSMEEVRAYLETSESR